MKKNRLTVVLVLFVVSQVRAQIGNPISAHESYFVPGGGYGFYFPKGLDSSGYYQGAIIEYQFVNIIHQTDGWGPSHSRFYGRLQILSSKSKNLKDLFMYSIGVDFSLEKNPKRNILIPYFGFEMGGISGKPYGTNFGFYPLAGIRLIALKNLNINTNASYVYPIKNFDVFRGWTAQATLNFSFW